MRSSGTTRDAVQYTSALFHHEKFLLLEKQQGTPSQVAPQLKEKKKAKESQPLGDKRPLLFPNQCSFVTWPTTCWGSSCWTTDYRVKSLLFAPALSVCCTLRFWKDVLRPQFNSKLHWIFICNIVISTKMYIIVQCDFSCVEMTPTPNQFTNEIF